MSNCLSSTQIGWSRPSGTRRSLRVKAGTSLTRRSISDWMLSKAYGVGMEAGSSTITAQTCISWAGVSR